MDLTDLLLNGWNGTLGGVLLNPAYLLAMLCSPPAPATGQARVANPETRQEARQ